MDHAQQQGSPAIVVQPHSAIQEDGGVAVVKSFSCSKSTRSNAPAMSKQEQQQRHEATLSPAPVAVIVEDETSSPSSTSSSDSSSISISISMMHDTRGKLEMTKTASGDDKQHHLQTILASPTKQHQDTSSGLGSPERGRQSTRGAALIRQSTPEAISRGGGGTGGASASVTPSPNKRSPPASSRRGNIRSPVPIAFSSGEDTNTAPTTAIGVTRNAMLAPPAPSTPTRKGRRATLRSRTPSKPRTPKGGLTSLRLGADPAAAGEDEDEGEKVHSLTPNKDKSRRPNRALDMTPTKKTKARQCFGSPAKDRIVVPQPVTRMYGLVQKATGSVGGNGCCGAIYGELTVGCMQKVVNCLKERAGFDENSSFIDVGSGLGKPNFHVAQDPGCEISYGLELEEVRWQLSVANHRWLLRDKGSVDGYQLNKHNVFFAHGDILSAKTFDPFTHVYMFDIGFPPATLRKIAKIFNDSEAKHLISYQLPRKVIDDYGFDVDKIVQLPLNLTVSNEGHMMYLYRRRGVPEGLKVEPIQKVDPFFAEGVRLCREEGGLADELTAHVETCFQAHTSGGVRTRTRRRAARP